MKRHTSLNVESEVLEKAKTMGLNLSEVAEQAMREALDMQQVEIARNITHCEFCGREMKKATEKDTNGLMWLYPDLKWICPKCLNKKVVSICKFA